jgi:hypothetical protein
MASASSSNSASHAWAHGTGFNARFMPRPVAEEG